ncbi:glycosyltransferase [Ochrobactrum pseudogrignonense]|uniref:Glycosyltransferase n=1 Tax=Brucella pseudogrignonensis TaxID=419475 RepID=A0A7Y3T0X0_9HYPH|nr:glycosyltransferase [Brucella pseudogrignonensis]NNV18870.1 glycosyltransferase [Brucella pseudogrignonensis]
MRILFDLQALQTESRFRGIGRYAKSLIDSLVRTSGNHQMIFVISDLFPETVEPLKAYFEELDAGELVLFSGVAGVRAMEIETVPNRLVQERIYSTFIADLKPDVLLILSPFEGYVDDAIRPVNLEGFLVGGLIHDLIPLVQKNIYLDPNPRYSNFYMDTLLGVKNFDFFLTNSDNTKQELLQHCHLNPDVVINIDGAPEPFFEFDDDKDEIHEIIDGKYILYSGGGDPRKNLPRLISAYSKLPIDVQREYKIVFAGRLSPGEQHVLVEQCSRNGLSEEQAIFTGYVSDRALRQLYSHCSLFIFPSYHEGLGLPVLEAMKCGAPVIVANAAALPALVDFDGALFDPFDVLSICDKIKEALTNEELRRALIENAITRCSIYTWERSAGLALGALNSLTDVKDVNFEEYSILRDNRYATLIEFIGQKIADDPDLEKSHLLQWSQQIANNQTTARRVVRSSWPIAESSNWRLEGPFDSTYSLALVNREIARALEVNGNRVSLHSTEGPGDFEPNAQFLRKHPDLKQLYDRSKTYNVFANDVQSRNIYPPRVSDMRGKINMLHNYAWEESGFPSQWVDQFNDYLDGIACVSNHVRSLLISNGVALPLSVTGNGVDHWEKVVSDKEISFEGREFKFLHVSSCFPRKGIDLLLEAFGFAFSIKDNVSLIIKTFPNPHNDVRAQLNRHRSRNPLYPHVIILEEDLQESQLKALYEACDVLVCPSFAEGFGLPLAEAMLSGVPVITTAWGGQMDFCSTETAWLLDYDFKLAKSHIDLPDSVWAVPKTCAIVNAMKEAYASSAEERSLKAELGKALLLKRFRWQHVAHRLSQSIKDLGLAQKKNEPRVGWVTTWDTKCGIATYSEHLLEYWPGQVSIFARKDGQRIRNDGRDVQFTWRDDNQDNLGETQTSIDDHNIDVIVIQFNYGFFNFKSFSNFIERNHFLGRKIIVVLHSTTDPVQTPEKKLENLVPALKLCDRLLVHGCSDLNRLKTHGLVENVAIFPHGILDFEGSANSAYNRTDKDAFTVATYGFFLPHKGLIETIQAFDLLREKGANVKLNMLNAQFPAPISASLIREAQSMIRGKLDDVVSLTTDFLSDRESLEQLSAADLILYPYQNTAESASGAVRYGLAVNKPVAVSPAPIFDDVNDVVFQLPGTNPEAIANGVIALRESIRTGDDLFLKKSACASRWCDSHRYSYVSKRLYNIVRGLWING